MIPQIMEIITKTLGKARDHAQEIIDALIESEQNYLFTNDMDFKSNRHQVILDKAKGGHNNINQRNADAAGHDMNQNNGMSNRGGNVFVTELRKKIDAYFIIVLRNVRDSVPKAIGYFLVRKSQDALQFELFNQVNENRTLSQALGEPESITEKRRALTDVLKTLNSAIYVL